MNRAEREWWRGYLRWGEETDPSPAPPFGYFVAYDASGQQQGHVWVDDIEAERASNPDLRYAPSKAAARACASRTADPQTSLTLASPPDSESEDQP